MIKKLKYHLFIGAFLPLPTVLVLIFSNVLFRIELIAFHSKTSFILTMFISLVLPVLALIFKKQIDPFNEKIDKAKL
jgi:hypothetical protein